MSKTEPFQDKYGFWYYPELPENTRVATDDDFENMTRCVREQKPFILKSFHSNMLECWRVKTLEALSKIRPWLDAGHIYIFE
jgi:hypothetical protein